MRAALAGQGRGLVSLDPGASGRLDEDAWLELLYDGLTYDCLGLAPGPALARPSVAFRLQLEAGGEDADSALEAIGLFPGPHCAAAAHALPVVRAQLALGLALAEHLPALAQVCWGPAQTAMSPAFFIRAVRSWLTGGPFPALALVAYRLGEDGALGSSGLAFFTGQELRIAPELAGEPAAATRLAARLVHELVAVRKVVAAQDFAGPDGEPLRLVPSLDGSTLTVVPL